MKALIFQGPRDIRYETVDDPIVSDPASAIVRIRSCSICGSDLHPYHVGAHTSGYCIGHEAVGEVVETGSAVGRFRVGDRVLVIGSISCGRCAPCLSGLAMQCRNSPHARVFGQGMPGIGGCQAEAVEVPAADANLHALPGDMPDELGLLLTDTLATAWNCATKARIHAGGSAAVIGLGAVGVQAVLAAFAQGAERVFAIDLLAERRQAAAELGAVPLHGDGILDEIMAATGGVGVDSVLDATGIGATLQLAVSIVRRGGAIAVVGIAEAPMVPFPASWALAKNVDVAFVACSVQAQLGDLFDALRQGRLDRKTLIGLFTHDMPLASGVEAYDLFDARRDGVKKIVLRA